jgi:hypothetical protein
MVVIVLSFQRAVPAVPIPPHSWIEHYQKQKEYQYREVKNTSSSSFWDGIDNWLAHIIHKLFYSKGTVAFWKFFPYFVAAIILSGLFWYFNRYGANKILGRSPSGFINSGLLTDNIHELDFDALISDAEKNRNYRWAMRWHYLNYLKQLDEREIIKWATHKTNTDYRREIKMEEQRAKFRRIARLYEDAWYGEWNVTATDYKIFVDVINSPVNQLAA